MSLLGNWSPRMGVGPCPDPFTAVVNSRLEMRKGKTGKDSGRRTCRDKSQAASKPTELFSWGLSHEKRGLQSRGVPRRLTWLQALAVECQTGLPTHVCFPSRSEPACLPMAARPQPPDSTVVTPCCKITDCPR